MRGLVFLFFSMSYTRIQKFRRCFSKRNLDAYLVVHDADIRYLTGFHAQESWLLVDCARAYFFTDSRYAQEARKHLKGITVKESRQPLRKELCQWIAGRSLKRIGFDERHFSVFALKELKAYMPKGVRLIAMNGVLERLRILKDPGELAEIKHALALNIKAYQYLRRVLHPGMRERDVLAKLSDFSRKHNIEFAFNPIIASGPNSTFPHAQITDRRILAKDILLVDMGMEINGYKSDLTRIFVFGTIAPSVERVYRAVYEAQQEALKGIKDGVLVSAVDEAARKSLKKQGLEKHFTHSLGHGVGLEIHEPPRLSVKSPERLQAGMVVTVEPGVYLKNKFGIRIEDMVLVTDHGCEVLSQSLLSSHPFLLK